MNELATLLNLPFDTLFVVAVGYLGFRSAYTGRAGGYSAVDVLFLSAVFGLIAKVVLIAISIRGTWAPGIYAAAIIVTVGGALVWRRWLQERLFRGLRHLGISDHDGFFDVWGSMLARPLPAPTQLVVRLKSGRHLMCDALGRFNEMPLGPCLLGEDGSVALYVTHVRTDPAEGWIEMEPFDANFGASMTFVRSEEISDIDIRRET